MKGLRKTKSVSRMARQVTVEIGFHPGLSRHLTAIGKHPEGPKPAFA